MSWGPKDVISEKKALKEYSLSHKDLESLPSDTRCAHGTAYYVYRKVDIDQLVEKKLATDAAFANKMKPILDVAREQDDKHSDWEKQNAEWLRRRNIQLGTKRSREARAKEETLKKRYNLSDAAMHDITHSILGDIDVSAMSKKLMLKR